MSNKMMNCKTCGEEIAKSAKKCPKCGAKNKKPIYKKKRFYLLVIIVLAIVVGVVFSKLGVNNANIGETYTSNGVEFTLNYVKFTDAMDNWGGANDTYWQPLDEALEALDGGVDRNIKKNALTPKSDNDTICVISYTAKNVSTSDKTIDDRGTLKYDKGYSYSDGGLSYRVSDEGVWKDINNGVVMEKLKDDGHEYRVYMVVPKELVENKDKDLTYSLFGKTFDLR